MAAAVILTREQHVLVSAVAGIAIYAAAVTMQALMKARGDRLRLAAALAALVRPDR
jgi:hypothetical protein